MGMVSRSNTDLIVFFFDMFTIFSFGVSSNLSQQKILTTEILGIISAVGLFFYDKF